jgi:hypothetical protein
VSTITKSNTKARDGAWPAFNVLERQRVYAIAKFVADRRWDGLSQTVIEGMIAQIWPDEPDHILAAAEFLIEVKSDGWPT